MSFYVTHLITGLGNGGAETMLYQILKYQDNPSIKYNVISMGAGSYYADKIRKLGIDVLELNIKKNPLSSVVKIYKELKKTDVLCCWMYHSNFVGYIIGRLAHVKKIIWNVRHSELSKEFNKKTTLQINKWCAKHSKKVSEVIFNGYKSRTVHEAIGYYHENCVVIGNGVDTEEYKPNLSAKGQICTEIGIPDDRKIILSVTKNHPIKDIPMFLKAFAEIKIERKDVVAIICGSGVESSNSALVDNCKKLNLRIGDDVIFLGFREDVPLLLSSCDLYVLHSAGEAFPNTLIQAMSCGCLCLTTDVGDAAKIIGDSSCVVPPCNCHVFSQAVMRLLELSKTDAEQKRRDNRIRIIQNFDIHSVVRQYESEYLFGRDKNY